MLREIVEKSYVPRLATFQPRIALGALGCVVFVLLGLLILRATNAVEMSQGETIVIALRLIVPLLILRFWLVGGIVAMLLDGADVIITDALDRGGFGSHYAELDKVLDTYYLMLELLVALGWRNAWVRLPALVLFACSMFQIAVSFSLSRWV